MKKILLLVSLFTALFATAQTQDSLFVWKAGVLLHKQSIKPADMDSITFKRPITPNGINIAGPNVTDIDGNTYQSVTNCGQTWTKQNLNVSKYSDGTPIPQVTNTSQWAALTTGAWCYYNNDPANGPIYGKLYNWYALVGIYDAASAANPALRKKLAPTGWHVSSDTEWNALINCFDPSAVGGNNIPNLAGGKMKLTGTLLWQSPNTGATNESGFTGLPGGYRNYDGSFTDLGANNQPFYFNRVLARWWSSAGDASETPFFRLLDYYTGNATRRDNPKTMGAALRCIKN
jgi:uncharacterized protein (TIGR02145 family)